MDVLLVCTGNICRSPMAEGLLRDRLARRAVLGGAQDGGVHVHSAGLLDDGQPASGFGVEVLGARGIDISGHRSTSLTPGLVAGADLLVGMARLHVREAVVLRPEAWSRSFTLKELVRRGEEVGARTAGQGLEEWLSKVHAGRSHGELLGEATGDDIFDPIGSSRAVYNKTAAEIADLVDRMVEVVFGPEPT